MITSDDFDLGEVLVNHSREELARVQLAIGLFQVQLQLLGQLDEQLRTRRQVRPEMVQQLEPFIAELDRIKSGLTTAKSLMARVAQLQVRH